MTHAIAERRVVAVALSRGASILVREADLTPAEQAEITDLLVHLVRQGVVACFTLGPPAEGNRGRQNVLDALRPHVGHDVMESTLAAGPPPGESPPAFLCSVWPFTPGAHGLVATGLFLGLDLDLYAYPSDDEETGFRLPLFDQSFLLHAAPVSAGFELQAPTTAR